MADGLLQWYDERGGEGRIVYNGQEYPVASEDMEPRARVPGARVHFDVERRQGAPVAVNVRLLEGTRVSRRQRRFGDMVGARRPDTRRTAPFARPHPEIGHELPNHPLTVARRWAEFVAAQEVDSALLLYAPDAVVHLPDGDASGRPVRAWLSGSGLPGHLPSFQTAGAGHLMVVRWTGEDGRSEQTWVRIAHGEIAEQWAPGTEPPAGLLHTEPVRVEPAVDVVALDSEAEGTRPVAEEKIRRVMDMAGAPILHAEVKLGMAPDPAVERPASAQATLDVNGQLVRAYVAATTPAEAVDLLERRLRERLQRMLEQSRARRHMPPVPEPGEWRHGQIGPERPPWQPRPPEDREIVRHKTFSLGELTTDEAVFDLEMLGYDFYLFLEQATGDDAVVHHLPDGGYGLRRRRGGGPDANGAVAPVTVEPEPAPSLGLDEALERLDIAGEPFVFYDDAATDRAHIVYRRYDGHYGLITPAAEPVAVTEPARARRRLRAELERLGGVRTALLAAAFDADSLTGALSETASIDQHPADLGTETFERERDVSLLEDVEQEIADVQRALVRLDRGIYGRCEACDRIIPADRMEAMPATRFCLEHQAETEVMQGMVR